jgi:magnesium-protoporphyrin O-methyltransferase
VAVTARLADALEDAGIQGRSVADLGSGIGDLLLTLLARGASSGFGIDLGSGVVEHARALATSRGLDDRATFVVGDASRAPLPPSDVVALNRVLCCYEDPVGLIGNAASAARGVVGFTAPVDRGVFGALNHALTWISNRWYALRRRKYRGFRAFVHDLASVEAQLSSLGFDRIREETVHGVWQLEVFARPTRDRAWPI